MSKALECAREVTDTAYTETGEGGHFIVESFAATIIQRYLDEAEERGAENSKAELSKMKEKLHVSLKAMQAVVDRWDSPKWKDLPNTGYSIDKLRAVIKQINGK